MQLEGRGLVLFNEPEEFAKVFGAPAQVNASTEAITPSSIAWSPDSRRLASGAHDETVRVWEPDAGERGPVAAAPLMRWVWAVAWAPDGRQLVTGAEDGAIRVWDPDSSATPPLAVADVDGGVWAVAWSPDGRRLAAGGADRVVRVWDAPFRDAPEVPLTGHVGLVRTVAWSPDSRRLATAADDGTVRVWDVATSRIVHQVDTVPEASRTALTVFLAPSATSLSVNRTVTRISCPRRSSERVRLPPKSDSKPPMAPKSRMKMLSASARSTWWKP